MEDQQQIQSQAGALPPTSMPNGKSDAALSGSTLNIALRNDSNSSTVYAYVTGRAIDNNNQLVLLQSDGRTPYYPSNPTQTLSTLAQEVAITLGQPGDTINIQIPRIAGGRIWFSINDKLKFFLNPGDTGPALVEPSVSNPSDPSIHVDWAFCEFTFNSDQLYANISYVDFISIPISFNLTTLNSGAQTVSGFPANGLQQAADSLRTQNAKDGAGWDRLIVPTSGNTQTPLRILSPNQGRVADQSLLANYFDPYVDQVYEKYQHEVLSVDTQVQFGVVSGQVQQNSAEDGKLSLAFGDKVFPKPSTSDIWTCSTGPFATGADAEVNAIIPRISAAFNRSELLSTNSIPASSNLYYQNDITNHYSRIIHSINTDGKGYAFPYDDVQPTGGADSSGKVQAGDPLLWTIAIGGNQVAT